MCPCRSWAINECCLHCHSIKVFKEYWVYNELFLRTLALSWLHTDHKMWSLRRSTGLPELTSLSWGLGTLLCQVWQGSCSFSPAVAQPQWSVWPVTAFQALEGRATTGASFASLSGKILEKQKSVTFSQRAMALRVIIHSSINVVN